jgi:hypothetical protein
LYTNRTLLYGRQSKKFKRKRKLKQKQHISTTMTTSTATVPTDPFEPVQDVNEEEEDDTHDSGTPVLRNDDDISSRTNSPLNRHSPRPPPPHHHHHHHPTAATIVFHLPFDNDDDNNSLVMFLQAITTMTTLCRNWIQMVWTWIKDLITACFFDVPFLVVPIMEENALTQFSVGLVIVDRMYASWGLPIEEHTLQQHQEQPPSPPRHSPSQEERTPRHWHADASTTTTTSSGTTTFNGIFQTWILDEALHKFLVIASSLSFQSEDGATYINNVNSDNDDDYHHHNSSSSDNDNSLPVLPPSLAMLIAFSLVVFIFFVVVDSGTSHRLPPHYYDARLMSHWYSMTLGGGGRGTMDPLLQSALLVSGSGGGGSGSGSTIGSLGQDGPFVHLSSSPSMLLVRYTLLPLHYLEMVLLLSSVLLLGYTMLTPRAQTIAALTTWTLSPGLAFCVSLWTTSWVGSRWLRRELRRSLRTTPMTTTTSTITTTTTTSG